MAKKRKAAWFTSRIPFTSKRVNIILSSSADHGEVARAIRSLRHGGEGRMKLSKQTLEKIQDAA
jgi:hypothetical protein